ncbi:MAG: outer membrane beta-barrel protein [Vicingaceae bacterium]
MKLVKTLCLIFLSITAALSARAEGDTKLIGIRAGYQYANVNLSGSNLGPVNGFYVGAFKNNKLVPTLHWTYGLEYFQTGYDKSDTNRLTMGTLSIPLNLKLKAGPIFALAGVSANFKLSEDSKFPPSQDISTKSFDLPVHVGLGFRVAVINIEARYHFGTMDVLNSGGKSNYLQLGLGFSF